SGAMGIEQMEVGEERGRRLHIGAGADPQRLDHAAARTTRRLAAEDRPLITVELEHRQRLVLRGPRELVEARVDEYPHDLELALHRRPDLDRRGGLAVTRALAVV